MSIIFLKQNIKRNFFKKIQGFMKYLIFSKIYSIFK